MEWVSFNEGYPEEHRWLLVFDTRGNYHVRTVNSLHREKKESGQDGIFTPARYGQGVEVTHWAYLEPPQGKEESHGNKV